MVKNRLLIIWLCLLPFFIFSNQSVVSYEITGGRFGDQLLSYLHAKWFSYEHELPLIYKPFPYSSFLVLDEKEVHYKDKEARKKLGLRPLLKTTVQKWPLFSKWPFITFNYQCPYFPECQWDYKLDQYVSFPVDWKDETFRKIVKGLIAPKEPLNLTLPPKDHISIALHIREGGGFDTDEARFRIPLKLPPLDFYIEGLKYMISLFPGQSLYCQLFTDALAPETIVKKLQEAIPSDVPIEFGFRQEKNHHDANVLEDFFSLFHFDILIRPESNYSIIPSLIHDYAIVYSPKNCKIVNNFIKITEVDIQTNEEILDRLLDPPPAKVSIVFVHLGPELPSYLPIALSQARLFNPHSSIYLLANEIALGKQPKELKQCKIKCVACESLLKSKSHRKFLATSKLNKKFKEGFWIFAMERFFYLRSFLKEHKLSSVFHLENDVMLYANLEKMLPIFKKNYPHMIGATFDNDERCVPGFLYISDAEPLTAFTHFAVEKENRAYNDMQLLSLFQKKYKGTWIDSLPVLIPEYTKEHQLSQASENQGVDSDTFCNHVDEFASIFDAAAIGQYLGGNDPWHKNHFPPGFINESCVFNPSYFQYEWREDELGRKIPFMIYKTQEWKINNLHIHSKNLSEFRSKEFAD